MTWWEYVIVLICILTFFYCIANRMAIKGVYYRIKTFFIVRGQKYHINGYAFGSEGESIYFDYIVINSSGIFALSVHDLKGTLNHLNGRVFLKAKAGIKSYMYFNPVPHDVRKVIRLNALVPEKADIIPVIIFPRGNDKTLRAMWLTPVNKLKDVLSEPCENPLSDTEVEGIYNSLKAAAVKASKAKKAERSFIKRHCPVCGKFLYDAQQGSKFYIRCRDCAFSRELTAAVIPRADDE